MTEDASCEDERSLESPTALCDDQPSLQLTKHTLKELNARNKSTIPKKVKNPSLQAPLVHPSRELARYARGGGPDLSDLRGCIYRMPGRVSSRAPKRTQPLTEETTTEVTKTDKITPYNPLFPKCLAENYIYSERASEAPQNLSEILEAIKEPIATFSQETYSEQEFQSFRRDSRLSADEIKATHLISPMLPYDNGTMAENHAFSTIQPFDTRLSRPRPDFYQGVLFKTIPSQIRTDIGHLITPSDDPEYPSIANFCIEVKGPKGQSHVAMLQVQYDGAMGSRAMLALQTYKQERIYDGKAYTFTATFLNGCLHLFAHHVTAPLAPGEKESYHITFLNSFAMDGDREQFIRGATALRNIAALASRYRDKFLDEARGKITCQGGPGDGCTNLRGGGLNSRCSSGLLTIPEEDGEDGNDEEDEDDEEEPAEASFASSINLKTMMSTATDVVRQTAGLKRRRPTSEDEDMRGKRRSRN